MLEMERLINSTLESRPNLSEVFSIYPAFRYRSLDRESSSRHLRIKSKNQENQHKRLMRLIHDPEKVMKKLLVQKKQQNTQGHACDISDICRKNIKSQLENRQERKKALSYLGIYFPDKVREMKRASTELSERKQSKQELFHYRKSQRRQIIFKLPQISELRRGLKQKEKKRSSNEQQIKSLIEFRLIHAIQLNNHPQLLTPCHERLKKYSLNQSTIVQQNKNRKQYISGWTIKQFD